MSLLVDARKKSQQMLGHATSPDELRLEDHTHVTGEQSGTVDHTSSVEDAARSAGQNLFNAKSPSSPTGRTMPNRNLLFALGGTILLLAIGGGYLWYLDSASDTALLRPIAAPPAAPIARAEQPSVQPVTASEPAAMQPAPQSALVPGIAEPDAAAAIRETAPITPAAMAGASVEAPQARSKPIRIEQRSAEPLVDPLLNDAYLAYQNGKPDEAQQLYLAMLNKDAGNMDALLGLAAIAQQRGENRMAAQYYARALALDPRNAFAHAGMSALTTDENNESRLKILLREQGNSAALHFALGNLYAEQSRWGEAQQAYFNAWTLEPGSAEFSFNLAVSLDHLGQRKLAADYYRQTLQLDPAGRSGFDAAQTQRRLTELTATR